MLLKVAGKTFYFLRRVLQLNVVVLSILHCWSRLCIIITIERRLQVCIYKLSVIIYTV